MNLSQVAFGTLRRNLELNRFEALFIGEADLEQVPTATKDYLVAHIEDVAGRNEAAGDAVPGWWEPAPPAALHALMPGQDEDFAEAVREALERLATATPNTASPGLLVVARTDVPALAILKLDLGEQEIHQFASEAAAEGVIAHQHLLDVLPTRGSLRKAALAPNPANVGHIRIVDDQANDGTASYWLSFLGVVAVPTAPRILKSTVNLVGRVLTPEATGQRVEAAIAETLAESQSATQPTGVRTFLNRVAERADIQVPADTLWDSFTEQAGGSLPPQAMIQAHTIERTTRVYRFHVNGQQVTIRGPVSALSGRVAWDPSPNGGYVITIRADDQPTSRLETR